MIKVVLKEIIEKPISGEWGSEGDAVNVLRTTNFTNEGYIDYSNVVKRSIDHKKVNSKKLIKGDIIIEKSGGSPTQPVGRVVYFDNDEIFLCNNFTAILRPKREQVYPKYLQYILFVSHQFGLTSAFQNKTTGIINLQLTKYIDGLEIPLPPLEVQQKIANILDAADALRQNNKTLVAKYDELTQALFLDMFGDPVSNPKGWEADSLKSHGTFKNGLNYSKSEQGVEIKYLGVGDFKSKSKIDDIENLSNIELDSLPEDGYLLNDGDLVFVRSNGNKALVGRCVEVYPRQTKLTFSGFCIRYRVTSSSVHPTYLTQLFRNKSFKNLMLESGQGANIQNINQQILSGIDVPLPPYDIQNQFIERVALIEEQKAIAQQELEKSEELFNSLLQKAFKGELV